MRESRTYGSVRGAGSDLRPYRDRRGHRPGTAAIWDKPPFAATEHQSDLSQYQLTVTLRGFAFSAFGAFVFARRLRKTPCRENREGVRWKGRCGHE